MSTDVVLVDDPAPAIRRITLNRPEKRKALNHDLRGDILLYYTFQTQVIVPERNENDNESIKC